MQFEFEEQKLWPSFRCVVLHQVNESIERDLKAALGAEVRSSEGHLWRACFWRPSQIVIQSSCLQRGKLRHRTYQKLRDSPPTGLDHTGIQSHIITDVPMSSRAPRNTPQVQSGQQQQLVSDRREWCLETQEKWDGQQTVFFPWSWPESQCLCALRHSNLIL